MSSELPTLLVLASTFPRWRNDTEPRFVYDLCLRLKNDYNMIVLAPHCIDAKQYELLDGIHVYRYRYAPEKFEILAYEGGITAKLKKHKQGLFLLPFFFIGQLIAILKLLRKHPLKAVHAHWLIPQGIIALAARVLSKNKPKIICTSHGGDLYGLNDPLSKTIKRVVIKNVDVLAVVSRAMQLEVTKLVPECSLPEVAPMGTDLHHLFTPSSGVERNPNQLLFVGRLVEKKGLKYLIKALPAVVKKHPKLELNIAGSGPEHEPLELEVSQLGLEKNVRFLGRLSHEELVTAFRSAGMAVFPFVLAKSGDVEGLGLVMVEAMGCGCPVIASNIPAVHDVIIDGETGLMVEPANSIQLSDQILRLMESPSLQESLASNARKYVLDKFDWEATSRTYKKLLLGVLAGSP